MRITAVETLWTPEYVNVLWVRIGTDEGITGLGETFYGAGAVAAHIHDTLAVRLLGQDPLRIEALNRRLADLPLAPASTGVEGRAVSAIDIALWDIFGKLCGQPVHQMLGGLCRDRQRIYNTCAGYAYGRSPNLRAGEARDLPEAGPCDDLRASRLDAGALAEDLLSEGITAMKIWPFDPIARETEGLAISAEQLRRGLEPFEKIRRRVGDRIEIMVEFHSLWSLPAAKRIARALEPYAPTWFEDPIRMTSPQALAEFARATPVWVCASETLGSRWPYKELLERDATHVVMVDLSWSGGLTEGRKIAALAETWHRPFAPHDCIGPVGFVAAVHMALSQPNTLVQETVRADLRGYYREVVTELPRIADGHVYPMTGAGLGTELAPALLARTDLVRRLSTA
ncbi:MAG: mandelate racemase/muconate lactonizing enzyme family protein [Rhodobacteraceae bacterium]|nr:mandelate racemase/muconate lactonizing enzyme family protein [Paracoccaceae bacterium]